MTNSQKTILDLLSSNNGPISFEKVKDYFRSIDQFPNKTTIYRNLEKLENEGLINRVVLSDQKMFWELAPSKSHNHIHLICNSCKNVECRDLKTKLDLNVEKFELINIEINLYGKCQKCSV
jgi:Fur family transcriptional regulator, ferric uptake regulator